MPLLTSVLVLMLAARFLGAIMVRFKQPAIVGEMLAGVVLGPSVLNLVHGNPALAGISELAVFLVITAAGLEMNFKDVVGILRGKGAVISLFGFFVPMLGGLAVGALFELDLMRTIFLGLCVSITALPVAVRILQSFKLLDSEIGRQTIAAAIANDIVALLILGVILNLPEQSSAGAVLTSVATNALKLLLLISLILGFNWLAARMHRRENRTQAFFEKVARTFGTEAVFGIVMTFVLAFGAISEALGFHFIIGSFFGALLIRRDFFRDSRFDEMERTLGSITGGFLAPVFFATLGLEFSIGAMHSAAFVAAVLVVSIVSKIAAGWAGARLIGISNSDAFSIGILLNGRGVMELVIASIAFKRGFIEQGLFSVLVLMGLVTTLITPVLLRWWRGSEAVLPNAEIGFEPRPRSRY